MKKLAIDKCQRCLHFAVCGKYDYEQDKKDCIDFADEKKFIDFTKYIGKKVFIDRDTFEYLYAYYDHKFIGSKFFLIGEIVSIIRTKKQLLLKIRVSNSIHTRYHHQRYPISAIGKTIFLTKAEAEAKLRELKGEKR